MIKIKHKDLDKFLVVMKYMMDERPDLNEGLMEFYCYLLDKRNDAYYDKQIVKSAPNLGNKEKEVNEDIAISLDELIWDMGMNLPSWDDDE